MSDHTLNFALHHVLYPSRQHKTLYACLLPTLLEDQSASSLLKYTFTESFFKILFSVGTSDCLHSISSSSSSGIKRVQRNSFTRLPRKPITINHLYLISRFLAASRYSPADKYMFLASCLVAFFGLLRICLP